MAKRPEENYFRFIALFESQIIHDLSCGLRTGQIIDYKMAQVELGAEIGD